METPDTSAVPEAAPAAPVAPTPDATIPQPANVPPAAPQEPVAPAPPVQPVVEPPVEPVQPVEPAQPVEPVQYVPTGNRALDAAAKIVSDKGFDPMALSAELQATGEFSPQTHTALTTALGADQVALLQSTYSTEIGKVQEAANARNEAVFTVVGGKEQWDAIAQWTTTPEAGLSPTAADAYNDMLAAGGVQAELAAKALQEAYMASPGFTQPTQMVTPTSVAPAAGGVTAISRPVYIKERAKAARSGDAATVQSLDARARFTMAQAPTQWRTTSITN